MKKCRVIVLVIIMTVITVGCTANMRTSKKVEDSELPDESLSSVISAETTESEKTAHEYALMCPSSILRGFKYDAKPNSDITSWIHLDYSTMLSTADTYAYYSDESPIKKLEIDDCGDWCGEYKNSVTYIVPNYFSTLNKENYTDNVGVDIAIELSYDESLDFCEDLYNALINQSAEFICEKIIIYNQHAPQSNQLGEGSFYEPLMISGFFPAEIEDNVKIDILNSIGFNGHNPYVLYNKNEKNNLDQSILVHTYDDIILPYDEPEPEETFAVNGEDNYDFLGEYTGVYMNNGGKMMMTMYIDKVVLEEDGNAQVSAIIAFKPFDNTYSAKSGTYFANGYFDMQAGTIVINPEKWISEQPEGYDMLGFKGFFNNGRIDALLDREELRELII